jgi:hypothetical protein
VVLGPPSGGAAPPRDVAGVRIIEAAGAVIGGAAGVPIELPAVRRCRWRRPFHRSAYCCAASSALRRAARSRSVSAAATCVGDGGGGGV